MGSKLPLLVVIICGIVAGQASAWRASCQDPYYGSCYGISHACPPGCPKLCEVDCKLCKPICPCDKPGAVCQDPRFIGGDGIMFYFHGKKDKDFCLVSDSALHINGHFIGKTKNSGVRRDFTWVQSIGVMFDSHQLYLGANKVGKWDDAVDEFALKLDGQEVPIPPGRGSKWEDQAAGLQITRFKDANAITVEVAEKFKITARVVPITDEESRVHNYEITEDDCFAHLELNFKFYSLTPHVTGVLGQTYSAGFRSPVKIGVAMPIMGGEHKFSVSHLFATDCKVARFGSGVESLETADFAAMSCGSGDAAGRGMVCRK